MAYAPVGASFDAGIREYGGTDASCPWTLVYAPPAPATAHIPASMGVADLNRDGNLESYFIPAGSFGWDPGGLTAVQSARGAQGGNEPKVVRRAGLFWVFLCAQSPRLV